MFSSIELLNLARERQGGASDYRIAKLLGVPQTTVSNYRTGRSLPANPIAMRLAALAEVDPLQAVVAVNLERAGTAEEREIWQKLADRLRTPKRRKLAD